MLEFLVLTIFPGLMIAAAASDVARLRIPNQLILLLVGFFCLCALLTQMPMAELKSHAFAGGAVLVAGFILFALGYIGGGDAKLLAAASLWLGLDMLLHFVFYTTMLGGALALMLLTFRRFPLPGNLSVIGWIGRLHMQDGPAPYGVAISTAALIVFSQSQWLKILA